MKRRLGILLLVAAGLIVVGGIAYTLMLPNIYQAQTRIAVFEEPPTDPDHQIPTYNPYFLRMQFEIMQSEPVLYEVIRRLNLQEEWGRDGGLLPRDTALAILKDSFQVTIPHGETLVTITCRRPDPYEAARIANEMAETYRDNRMELKRGEIRAELDKLDVALEEQSQRVLDAEARIQNVRVRYDVQDDSDGESPNIDRATMVRLQSERLDAQQTMVKTQASIIQVDNLLEQGVLDDPEAIASNPEIVRLVQQLQDIMVQLARKAENLGPNDPDIIRLNNQREQVVKALNEQLQALRSHLQSEYDDANAKLDRLDELMTMKMTLILPRNGAGDEVFRKALADLENERLIFNQLSERIRQQMIEMQPPRSPVVIVDDARPNLRPVSPNLFLNALVSLAIGGCFAVAGRAELRRG